jgi:hypothetical protein
MSLPYRYTELETRFASVRGWAKQALGESINRCAVCMSYTLRVMPGPQEASVADIAGVADSVAKAGQVPGSAGGTTAPNQFFIRAAELLPVVQRVHGPPDATGPAHSTWTKVEGQKGVLYVEDCYPTAGDKRLTIAGLYEPTSGDHWDLFDGIMMVAEGQWLRNNHHKGTMSFWRAR